MDRVVTDAATGNDMLMVMCRAGWDWAFLLVRGGRKRWMKIRCEAVCVCVCVCACSE